MGLSSQRFEGFTLGLAFVAMSLALVLPATAQDSVLDPFGSGAAAVDDPFAEDREAFPTEPVAPPPPLSDLPPTEPVQPQTTDPYAPPPPLSDLPPTSPLNREPVDPYAVLERGRNPEGFSATQPVDGRDIPRGNFDLGGEAVTEQDFLSDTARRQDVQRQFRREILDYGNSDSDFRYRDFDRPCFSDRGAGDDVFCN